MQGQKHSKESDKVTGNLYYHLATKLKKQISGHRPLLVEYVAKKKLASEAQLNGKCM